MIGKLKGYIDSLTDDRCIIDVGGVGYLVSISNKTSPFLSKINNSANQEKNQVSLIIETIVKEDSIELFGFASEIERKWFLELTKVQGVGAKVGLKILAHFTIDEIAKSLIAKDHKAFCQVPGIGPKLGQRITTELKDSPKKLGIDVSTDFGLTRPQINSSTANLDSQIANDALSALENLGYKKGEALPIIQDLVKNEPKIKVENLITKSLQHLSKRVAG